MEVTNEAEGDVEDVNMAAADTPAAEEPSQEPANKKQTRSTQPSSLSREASVDMLSENDSYALSSAPNRSPPSGSSNTSTTPASGLSDAAVPQSDSLPPIEQQITIIRDLSQVPLTEGMPGYVISNKWLQDAQDRAEGLKKGAEWPLPPIDTREFLAPVHIDEDLRNELGEDFFPLKPGLTIGQEIEILPTGAYNQITKWYGIADGSPWIRRFCHNTSSGPGSENLAYEMYPPVFTVMKLPGSDSGLDSESLEDRQKRAPRVVASRASPYETLLSNMKVAANIPRNEDVRVWRVLSSVADLSQQTGIMTPAQSRSNSPAPTSFEADLGEKLVLDANRFLGLQEGSQRELVEVPDATNKPSSTNVTVDAAGLGQEGILIFEQRIGGPAGGEWASDSAATKMSRLGFKLKPKSAVSSGRTSPAPGMQTRGRTQKLGRARGTTGLANLGNTCYMNSALQCVKSVQELTAYFLEDKYQVELNPSNPLGHGGEVARSYASLVKQLFGPGGTSFSPRTFKQVIGRYGPSFSGYGQQDSQEFLLFLLDGLQEDLNRIHKKPYIEKPDSTDEMVYDEAALTRFADRCWEIYKARNDSVITDLFAGMYKSTVKCPVCDKVSIIFDPFNNLTLQLPIENAFTRKLPFVPLNLTPFDIDIDIDKNATFAQLKEYIGQKVSVDSKKLVLAEIYKNRFFKMFDDRVSISEERIPASDYVVCFELDEVPSEFPPKRAVQPINSSKFFQNDEDDDDAPELEKESTKMLIPVFNRAPKERPHNTKTEMHPFGDPFYIVLTDEEAKDEEAILKKILARVATMTTKDILEQCNESDGQGSDLVLLNRDDADSGTDAKVQAQSIQSEEGMVDVSMNDSDGEPMTTSHISLPPPPRIKKTLPTALHPDHTLNFALTNLFEMKYCSDAGTNQITTGWNAVTEHKSYPSLASRRPKLSGSRKFKPGNKGAKLKRRIANGGSDSESSDEDLDNAPPPANPPSLQSSTSSDEDEQPPVQPPQAPEEHMSSASPQPTPIAKPLVEYGEGIVCDWNPESYNSLFSEVRDNGDSDFRGSPTWDMQRPLLADPEIERKRKIRDARKRDGVTLNDCLEEFGKEEILSENDAWYCPRCKEHRRASKKFELWKAPDILVIHLKRFSAQGRLRDKLDVKVDFPTEGLDLSPRVAVHEEGKDLIYDLFAVDNHYGGLGGGHYTAFAQNFNDGQWWEYNDSIATRENNPQAVVTRAAYLLFYRRRSDTTLGGPFFENLVSKEAENETESASSPQSRTQSPSHAGEGRRLDDFSRTGLSSAFPEAEAVHQAGGGGLRGKTMSSPMLSLDDELPSYSDDLDPDKPMMSFAGDSSLPDTSHQGAVVTWEGFGKMVSVDDDVRSTGASSTGAVHEDGDSVRTGASNSFAPGTPVETFEEPVAPAINISAPGMEDAPDIELEDQKVAEVRLDNDDPKVKSD